MAIDTNWIWMDGVPISQHMHIGVQSLRYYLQHCRTALGNRSTGYIVKIQQGDQVSQSDKGPIKILLF